MLATGQALLAPMHSPIFADNSGADAAEREKDAATQKQKDKTFCESNKKRGETVNECIKRREETREQQAQQQAASAVQKSGGASSTTQSKLGTPNSLGIPSLGLDNVVVNIVAILGILVGVLSTIFIAVAGVRYAASNGNPSQIEGAKRTLTYAIAGLVISLLAGGIVGFIIARV